MAGQGRHVLIVEDEQDERYALRPLLEVWEHRVEEARGIQLALDRRPERGMARLLRAGLGLLVVPLVVAGYAGLAGFLLPLVALRRVFRRRGRRPRRRAARSGPRRRRSRTAGRSTRR